MFTAIPTSETSRATASICAAVLLPLTRPGMLAQSYGWLKSALSVWPFQE